MSKFLTPAAVLVSLSLAVAPAFAGQHSRGSGSGSRGSSAGGSRSAPAPRSAGPSRSYSGPSRPSSGPSRNYGAVPRTGIQSRGFYSAQPRGYGYRGYGDRGYGYRGFGSRGVFVAPSHFYRPYYSFRPRFSLGFGLWVGYPIAYSYPFYYGYYGYPYPYYPYDGYYDGYYGYPPYYPPTYSYPIPNSSAYPPADYPPPTAPQSGYYESDSPQGSVMAQPGSASGGVSFDLTPSTAEVYIDNKYVGRVSDLGPTTQPMGLTPGRHHIEVRASGYQTISIDADVVAGQVIPYQGAMQQVR